MSDLLVEAHPSARLRELAGAMTGEAPAASAPTTSSPGTAARWSGRVLSALPALFLLLDGAAKLFKPEPVLKGTIELGYPESVIIPLGIVLLASTILYIVPRTAVLGAILLTGYLGGAVATHVRVGHPLFSHTLFPTYLGVLLWAGLLLRDPRLRGLLPFRSDPYRASN